VSKTKQVSFELFYVILKFRGGGPPRNPHVQLRYWLIVSAGNAAGTPAKAARNIINVET
jgi:hypothetical protein